MWCLQVRKSSDRTKVSASQITPSNSALFLLKQRSVQGFVFSLVAFAEALVLAWAHTSLPQGAEPWWVPALCPFQPPALFQECFFPVPPHIPQARLRPARPVPPFEASALFSGDLVQLPPVPGTLPGHRSAERVRTPQERRKFRASMCI